MRCVTVLDVDFVSAPQLCDSRTIILTFVVVVVVVVVAAAAAAAALAASLRLTVFEIFAVKLPKFGIPWGTAPKGKLPVQE